MRVTVRGSEVRGSRVRVRASYPYPYPYPYP